MLKYRLMCRFSYHTSSKPTHHETSGVWYHLIMKRDAINHIFFSILAVIFFALAIYSYSTFSCVIIMCADAFIDLLGVPGFILFLPIALIFTVLSYMSSPYRRR
jgi:hypothetical protein